MLWWVISMWRLSPRESFQALLQSLAVLLYFSNIESQLLNICPLFSSQISVAFSYHILYYPWYISRYAASWLDEHKYILVNTCKDYSKHRAWRSCWETITPDHFILLGIQRVTRLWTHPVPTAADWEAQNKSLNQVRKSHWLYPLYLLYF